MAPHVCAVLLVGEDPDGFVDAGTDCSVCGTRVYVSHKAIRAMARLYGYATPQEAQESEEALASKDAEIDRLQAELEDERRVTNAIDVLESRDFTSRKKRGPKRQEVSG